MKLSCPLIKLSFGDWLKLEESVLFNSFPPSEAAAWLLQQEVEELAAYSSQVSLIKIGNNLYKLDGKHLKQAFLTGHTYLPAFLIAQVYEAEGAFFNALDDKLTHVDKDEPPSPQDEIKLIYNELGLDFKSDRIRSGFISEMLNIALRGNQRIYQDKRKLWRNEINMKKAVSTLRDELLVLDGLKLKPKVFNTGVLAACLIMLSVNKNFNEFIVRLNEEQGENLDDKYDPVECVLRAIKFYKASSPASKRRGTVALCQITVQAILLWLEGRESPDYWRKTDLLGIDYMPYVNKLRQIKCVNTETDI
jgi:hypothetical protein